MRFSNRTIYGVRAVVDLAYHDDGEPMQVRDIARRASIPERFLEQIFQDLKQAGIVASKRGPGGGFRLDVNADELTLRRVFEVLEALPTLPEIAGTRDNVESAAHIADAACGEIIDRLVEMLDDVTITDLVQRGEQLGLAREGYEGFVYVI